MQLASSAAVTSSVASSGPLKAVHRHRDSTSVRRKTLLTQSSLKKLPDECAASRYSREFGVRSNAASSMSMLKKQVEQLTSKKHLAINEVMKKLPFLFDTEEQSWRRRQRFKPPKKREADERRRLYQPTISHEPSFSFFQRASQDSTQHVEARASSVMEKVNPLQPFISPTS